MNYFISLILIFSLLFPNALVSFKAYTRPPITGVINPLINKPEIGEVNNVEKAKFKKSVGAWFSYWDEKNATRSFRQNKDVLNEISPYWYFVKSDGTLKASSKFNLSVIKEAKKADIKVIPMVSNNFDGNKISNIINNPSLRKVHIRELTNKVVKRDLDGIDLDYEGLLAKDRKSYAHFVKILAKELHKHDKLLSVTLQAKVKKPGHTNATKAQSWPELGKHADRLRIMAYDYHWKTSGPGPIAPRFWVEQVAKFAKKTIPSHKVIIAIGTYGYHWDGSGRAKAITVAQAKQLAKSKKVPIRRDKKSFEQFLKLEPGKPRIWLQDSGSLKAKLKVVKKYDLGGVVFWRLGDEDPDTWKVLKEHYVKSQ